jgi:hypothetical protein
MLVLLPYPTFSSVFPNVANHFVHLRQSEDVLLQEEAAEQ